MSKTSAATLPALAGSSLVAMATGAMLWLLITAALAGCATEPPAAVVVAAPKASAAVAQVEPRSIAEEPVARQQITISSCERAGCALVFRFAQPMPDARVELDPPQAGSQRWTGEKELTFTPGRGAMGWGHQVTARIGAQSWHIAVPNFVVAGKVASWPVIEGKPRFIAFLGGREQIGRGPIYLLYDQRVDPNAVARHIEAEDGESRPVAVRLWRPARVESYYGPIDSDVVLALQMLHPPPSGTRLKLSVPGYVGGVRLLEDHSFEVLTDFRLERSGSERLDRAPQELEFRLHSTTPVSGAALRDAWRISPKLSRLYVYGDDRELYVSASLQPGKAYRFELPKGFRDALGNRLQKALKLRVQVQDLSPSLQLPRGPLVVERGGARLPIVGVNIGAVRAELHRYRTPAEFIKPGETCEGPVAFRARGRGAGAINRKAVQDLPLAGVKPGLYCVDVAAEGRGSEAGGEMRESMRVQVSNLGATAKVYAGRVFAWVTRLDDPQPMARARVSVIDESGARYGSGVTAKDGIAVLDAPAEGKKLFLLVQHKNDAAVLELSEERLSQAWKFSLPGVVAGQRPLAAAVFTDRGAYRPGESVHVKMIVRDPMTFRIPPDGEVNVSVQDSRGQKVIEKSVALDMLGSADLEVPVKEGAPVGEYTVRVAQGAFSALRRFRVEEYRVPTFEVTVSAQESEWKPGEEIHATAEAKYLHGGNLGGREVKWQVTTAREPFAPAAFPGFIFGDGRASAPQADGQVASGEGKLDGAGKISFSFKADVHGDPARFVAEATVTDVDRQAYAGRLTRVVHPAAVYVGARQPPERVLTKGDVLEVPLVAVRPDGSAQAGVEVRAVLSRVDYHTVARLAPDSVQLLSRPVYEEGEECVAVTTQSGAVCRFLVENAGEHSLTVRAQEASAAFTFLAAGRSRAAWPRFDRERIELVADKPSYQPGDVARLVVQTPYPHARGLLTLERDGVIEHRLFQIDGDTPAIEVKIAERHAPNVFASVVLLRGRVHGEKNAAGQETGAPGFRIGYANLKVEPAGRRLAVRVEPSARTAAPGEKLGISLHAGKRGQASVWVVDEAVLGLTRYRTPDALGEIFSPRALAVRTGESRLELFANRRARREEIFPAGDGGEGFSQEKQPPLELRNLFQSTAYWNGAVPLDEAGDAFVEFKLPDNLTTYRVMAVAYDKDGRAGSGDAKVTVRKPVMVSPVLPRFVYPGDQLELSAQVFNGTGGAGEAEIEASFDGKAQPRTTLQIEPGQSRLAAWPITISGRGAVTVRYTARIGKDADAVEVKLPILVPGNRRVMVAQRQVSGDAELSLRFPDDRQPGSAKAEVVVSSTSLSALKGAVDYLMDYPNGCIEQTTSTAYPLVVLKDLLPEIGVSVDEASLKKFSEAGVKRILSFQTEKGGLSYWPGGREPHAFATAFGLTALIEAKKRGYDVPDEKLARMADFLEWSLKQGKITGEMPHAGLPDGDTRALFVMTLGRLGRPQPAWINTLWRNKDQVSPFGLSLLAVAVQELPGDKSLLAPLLAEVENAAQKNSEEAWYAQERKGGWSMDSPLRTHAGALLAFAESGQRAEMTPKLLEGLLHRQTYGMWGNTQENVFGIMGVAALAGASDASGDAPRMELRIGDRRLHDEDLEPVSKRVHRLSMTERELPLPEMRVNLHNGGGAPIFFTVRGEYQAQLTAKNRAARSDGFSLERRYELLDGAPLGGRAIPLGQLVRVRLSVHAEEKQNYVAIDDKLPAGLEPLNASLATTGSVAQGKITPELERGLSALSYSEVRDARVAFFADELPAGDYEFDYLARATTAGHFLRPAASAEAMYLPEKSGATAIDEVEIR